MKKYLVLPILCTLLFTSCGRSRYTDKETIGPEANNNNENNNSDNNSNNNSSNNNDNNNTNEDNTPDNPSNPGSGDNKPIHVDGDHSDDPQDSDDPSNPQTEEEVYGPNPEPLDIETELEPNYTSISLTHYDLELDCQKERTNSYSNSSNFNTGKTSAILPKSVTITCNYQQQFSYLNNQLSVYWFIDEVDNPYFALTNISQSSENSKVTIVAKEESRLATLTAALIYNEDTTKVLKTLKCRLRSVMTNISNTSTIKPDKNYGGRNTENVATGYQASFFNKQYTENDDIVVPSVLKIGSYTRSVSRLNSFADITGTNSQYSSGTDIIHCRNLYIPNSVYSLGGISAVYAHKKIIFADGDINSLYIFHMSLYQQSSDYYHFYKSLVDGTPFEFPYNYYMDGSNASVPQNITPEMFDENKTNFNSEIELKNILPYNLTSAIAFKKI